MVKRIRRNNHGGTRSWNTAADGTGSAFTATTAVNQSITVYAQWTFAPGSIAVDSESGALVHNAPVTTTNKGEGDLQGTWWDANTINSDGSVTFASGDSTAPGGGGPAEYKGGMVRYMFPQDGLPAGESIEDYDFFKLEYVHTIDGSINAMTLPFKIIWKKGKSDVDYSSMTGGAYTSLAVSAASATSSTPEFAMKLAGYHDISGTPDLAAYESGLGIQRSNYGGTVKFIKAVFTKGTRYTITLDTNYTEGEDFDDISAVATVAINELPTPADREGYKFAGWFDDSETTPVLYSNITAMPAKNLTLTAHWSVYKPTAPITVDFTGMTFRSIGGSSTVELLENDEEEVIGYTFTNTAYGSGQAFTVKLPDGFFLGDYDNISFTITKEDQDTYTDANYKECYVLGGKPTASGSTANNNVSTYTGAAQNIRGDVTTNIVLPIDKASTLTTVTLAGGEDPIELVVYINSGPNGAKYSVTNFRIYQD